MGHKIMNLYETQNPRNVMGRRRFLQIATITVGTMGVGGSFLGSAGTAEAASEAVPKGVKHMTLNEYKVFQRLIDAHMPTAGTQLPNPAELPVMQTLDAALLAGMAPHVLAGLKGGIEFFDAGPQSSFNNKRFTELSDSEARAFCDAWANADTPAKRGIVVGLKKLAGLAYWSNPKTWPAVGYDGPATKGTDTPSYGNAPLPA